MNPQQPAALTHALEGQDSEPQPSLLHGLPNLALHHLLEVLPSNDKATLMRVCKQTQEAVLHHAPVLKFHLDDSVSGQQSGDRLVCLLASRTVPLHLKLHLAESSNAATTSLMEKLSTQPHANESVCMR